MNENSIELCSYEHFEIIRNALRHTVGELELKAEYESVLHFEYNIVEMVKVLHDVFDSYNLVENNVRDLYYRDRLSLSAIARCVLELTTSIYYYFIESPVSIDDSNFRKDVFLYNYMNGLVRQTNSFPDPDVKNKLLKIKSNQNIFKQRIIENSYGSEIIKKLGKEGFEKAVKGNIALRSSRRGINQSFIKRLYSATSNYIHSNPLSFDYQTLRTDINTHKVLVSTCVYSFVSMSVLEITEKYKLDKGDKYHILEFYSKALKASK